MRQVGQFNDHAGAAARLDHLHGLRQADPYGMAAPRSAIGNLRQVQRNPAGGAGGENPRLGRWPGQGQGDLELICAAPAGFDALQRQFGLGRCGEGDPQQAKEQHFKPMGQ